MPKSAKSVVVNVPSHDVVESKNNGDHETDSTTHPSPPIVVVKEEDVSAGYIASIINLLVATHASTIVEGTTDDNDILKNYRGLSKLHHELSNDYRSINDAIASLTALRDNVNQRMVVERNKIKDIIGDGPDSSVSTNKKMTTDVKVVTGAEHIATVWGLPVTNPPPQIKRVQPVVTQTTTQMTPVVMDVIINGLAPVSTPVVENIEDMKTIPGWQIRYVKSIDAFVMIINGILHMFGHCKFSTDNTNIDSSEICVRDHGDPGHRADCDLYHPPVGGNTQKPPMYVGPRHLNHTVNNLVSDPNRVRMVTGWNYQQRARIVNATFNIIGAGMLNAIVLADLNQKEKKLSIIGSSDYISRKDYRQSNHHARGNNWNQ